MCDQLSTRVLNHISIIVGKVLSSYILFLVKFDITVKEVDEPYHLIESVDASSNSQESVCP